MYMNNFTIHVCEGMYIYMCVCVCVYECVCVWERFWCELCAN